MSANWKWALLCTFCITATLLLLRVQQPVYVAVFHTPKWNRIHKAQAFVSLVLKITAVDTLSTDAAILEDYVSPYDNMPDVTGCVEQRLLWTRVPIRAYQNVKMYIARCTPTRNYNVTMMYHGNNVLFIQPCSQHCDVTPFHAVECDVYNVEYEWFH